MMKKIKMFVMCSMAMCMLMACGSKNTNSNEEEDFTVKGVDGKDYTSYQEACRAEDFEAAHKFLDKLYDIYMEKYGRASYEDLMEVRSVYQSASNYIFKQEIMFLISDGSEQAADKVLYLLTEIPVEGRPLPEGQYSSWETNGDGEGAKDHRTYSKWVANYNANCCQILDLAISQNNNYLAKKVITMYKQNVVTTMHFLVKYSWTDKDAAQAKYDKAFGEKKEEVVEEEDSSNPNKSKKKRKR